MTASEAALDHAPPLTPEPALRDALTQLAKRLPGR